MSSKQEREEEEEEEDVTKNVETTPRERERDLHMFAVQKNATCVRARNFARCKT